MLELNGPSARSSACHWDPPECVEVQYLRACDSKAIKTTRWVNNSPTPLVSGMWPTEGIVELHDTKTGPETVVQFTESEWRSFLAMLPHKKPFTSHTYVVCGLQFTYDEWAAFRAGAAAGEFATV